MNSLDPAKILSFGAIGLALLLMFFAYSLIRNVRSGPQELLVKLFMAAAVVLSLTSFALEGYRQSKLSSELTQVQGQLNNVCSMQTSSLLDHAGDFRQKMSTACAPKPSSTP